MKTIIVMALLLSGCGVERDERLNEYFNEAARVMNIDVSNISWVFEETLEKNVVARCYHRTGLIVYSRAQFEKQSKQVRVVTAMHELGHCALNLGHDDTMNNFCPVSYMHSKIPVYTGCMNAFYSDK